MVKNFPEEQKELDVKRRVSETILSERQPLRSNSQTDNELERSLLFHSDKCIELLRNSQEPIIEANYSKILSNL